MEGGRERATGGRKRRRERGESDDRTTDRDVGEARERCVGIGNAPFSPFLPPPSSPPPPLRDRPCFARLSSTRPPNVAVAPQASPRGAPPHRVLPLPSNLMLGLAGKGRGFPAPCADLGSGRRVSGGAAPPMPEGRLPSSAPVSQSVFPLLGRRSNGRSRSALQSPLTDGRGGTPATGGESSAVDAMRCADRSLAQSPFRPFVGRRSDDGMDGRERAE